MRTLHSADWHLEDRLGRTDRIEDLRRGVERTAHFLDGFLRAAARREQRA